MRFGRAPRLLVFAVAAAAAPAGVPPIRVTAIAIHRLSLVDSAGAAELEIGNPYAGDLRVAAVRCELRCHGRVIGRGSVRPFSVRAQRVTRVELPIRIAAGAAAAALGSTAWLGGETPATLSGEVVVSLPGGEKGVPFAAERPMRVL